MLIKDQRCHSRESGNPLFAVASFKEQQNAINGMFEHEYK